MSAPDSIEDLPAVIPVFPITGALLMPGARMPLQIFEPRYLAMTEDAMSGARIIGMIQPRERERIEPDDNPDIYGTGCAGHIGSYSDTGDGRCLISLSGVCRFRVEKELPPLNGYRRVQADYGPYSGDLTEIEPHSIQEAAHDAIDRDRLLSVLRRYFEQRQLDADWESIEDTSNGGLVTALSMLCPLAAEEKQALLEAPDVCRRAELLIALLEMGVAGAGFDAGSKH